MDTLSQYVDRLYNLGVGVIGQGADQHERPHKPVMLLTVIDLIEAGAVRENRIAWTDELRDRFRAIFEKVRSSNDQPSPENPFFYLRSDEFWHHVAEPGREDLVRNLRNPPRISDLANGLFHVELDPELFAFLVQPKNRSAIREALISRYFPGKRSELLAEASPRLKEEKEDPEVEQGRSAAFRHLILETYDYQCVACGLRIRLPDDITIVDAAHLIPFSVSRNDHPTNGFALCKNHHWAFDRHLLTPTHDGVWRVSKRLESRRSRGESDLVGLDGQSLLPPREDAFSPCAEAITWREERLLN